MREGRQHCAGHTGQPGLSQTTCFSRRDPPLASFLGCLGLGLPQRMGVLAQPGCGATLVSAAKADFSTGSVEKGKRDAGCSLKCTPRGAPGKGRGRSQTFCQSPEPGAVTIRLPCLFGNGEMNGEMGPKRQGFPWEARPGAGPPWSPSCPRREKHRRALPGLVHKPLVKNSNFYGRELVMC